MTDAVRFPDTPIAVGTPPYILVQDELGNSPARMSTGLLSAIIQAGEWVPKDTKAHLLLVTAVPDNTIGLVFGDGTPANNGVYVRGSSTWTKIGELPPGMDLTALQTQIDALDVHAAVAKTTPVDADEIGIIDSAASNVPKKVTWANIKVTLKAYFDTLYQPVAAVLTATTASFTTTLLSKLNAIEAAADVTDAVNISSSIHGTSGKSPLVNGDEFLVLDSEAGYAAKRSTWANLQTTLMAVLGPLINAGNGKTSPVGADLFVIADSEAASATKKVSLTNVMATFFAGVGGLLFSGNGKSNAVDADLFLISDSENSNATKKLAWSTLKSNFMSALGALIAAATGKTAPVGGDLIIIADSEAANATKKLSLTNFAAWLFASPALTGNPTAPTASLGDNDTSIANTAFVKAAIDAVLGGVAAGYDTLVEIAAAITALLARSVSAGGIATGGGTLAADRTITVTKATAGEVEAGTNDSHAVTPLALAPTVATVAAAMPASIAAYARPIPNGRSGSTGAPERITESNIDGTALLIQYRKENLSWSAEGIQTAYDWRPTVKGSPGATHVYVTAPGVNGEVQVSTAYDGDSHDFPKVTNLSMTWRADVAGTPVWIDLLLAGNFIGLDGNCTDIDIGVWIGQSTSGIGNLNNTAITSSPARATRSFMPWTGSRILNNEQLGFRRKEKVWQTNLMDFVGAFERLHGISTQKSGETTISAAGWYATQAGQLPSTMAVVQTAVGCGGISYSEVAKGSVPYANAIDFVKRARLVTLLQPRSDGSLRAARCLGINHPWHENNVSDSAATVSTSLQEDQANWQTDLQKIFGTSDDYPLFTDALGSFGILGASPTLPYGVLAAALTTDKVVYVLPRYFLPHLADDVHLTAASEAQRGAYYARARVRRFLGKDVSPTYMLSAVRSGSHLTITFNKWADSAGGMAFNTSIVSFIAGFGFTFRQTGGNSVKFSDVEGDWTWTDDNILETDLKDAATGLVNTTPTGTSQKVGYADQSGFVHTGPTAGPRGNVMEPSLDVGLYGEPMHRWPGPQEITVT